MKPSQRADEDISNLERLSRKYINSGNKNAEAELSEMVIEGTEFIKLLNNLGIETEKETVEYLNTKANYEQLREDYDELKQNHENVKEEYKGFLDTLGLLLKNPIFSSIEGLIKIIREEEDKAEKMRRRF